MSYCENKVSHQFLYLWWLISLEVDLWNYKMYDHTIVWFTTITRVKAIEMPWNYRTIDDRIRTYGCKCVCVCVPGVENRPDYSTVNNRSTAIRGWACVHACLRLIASSRSLRRASREISSVTHEFTIESDWKLGASWAQRCVSSNWSWV